jgi:hypothetical protein
MTQEQAQMVKSLLVEIRDTLPADKVDTIYNWYKEFINPNHGKPCTCQPKYWNDMLVGLKNKVEETLASYEQTTNPIQEDNN